MPRSQGVRIPHRGAMAGTCSELDLEMEMTDPPICPAAIGPALLPVHPVV
jgi:hypothetical protein